MKKQKLIFSIIVVGIAASLVYMKYHNMNVNDIGLKVLSLVKKIKGEKVDLSTLGDKNRPLLSHDAFTSLLQYNVTPAGDVNYKGFSESSAEFQNYLDDLSAHPPGNNWSEAEEMAYWINAYNAFTVKLIIDHYPLESIKDLGKGLPVISSPWDLKFFKIGELDFDLNTIEHEILRKKFNEPRIHFAINCASFSCPKLRNEAFVPARLEAQLEDQTMSFIHNPDKNIINASETLLSSIFDWFASDFNKNEPVLDFIKRYQPELNKANKVEYISYSWKLNE